MKKLASCVLVIILALSMVAAMAETWIIRQEEHSMDSTINNGDELLAETRTTYNRNDIVVCRYPSGSIAISRIVGVPGDTVYRNNGVTHIVFEYMGTTTDMPLDERYAAWFKNGSPDDYESLVLGDNEYFVAGDSRYNSIDSRNWKDSKPEDDVGPLPKESLLGVIIGRIEYLK